MKIIGPDELVFSVDYLAGCTSFLTDYGLKQVSLASGRIRFETLDGTGVLLVRKEDCEFPNAVSRASGFRETIYGVADNDTLRRIADDLSRDREVKQLADGTLHAVDDMGFGIGFQLSRRRAQQVRNTRSLLSGSRPMNDVAVEPDMAIAPRTLSHVVFFVPDAIVAERFYVERLGFRVTDRFTGVGSFLRPAGTQEHHTLFFIQTPEHMKGIEHFACHVETGSDVLLAGTRFAKKGYQSFWGPGRHLFGSNWFWYFNSPLGCKVEYDADMDLHDDSWQPRERPMSADNAQLYLFTAREKWMPGGPH